MSLEQRLAPLRARVEQALEALLPRPEGPAAVLAEAMRHAVLGGGKRIRPLLALASAEACGADPGPLVAPAAALELIHTYSLVHDDLPCMDDDALRRGRPTVHVAFGEAEAVLAGDALQALGFEVLARLPDGEAHAARRADAVALVARAAGAAGMVGGQQGDLLAERRPVDAAELEWIHRHKTGALLAASAEVGAVWAGAGPAARAALARYGAALGLAFQIADDVLDETAPAAALGKTPGKDRRAGKATWPALVGLDAAAAAAARRAEEAVAELERIGAGGTVLADLARFAASRTH